MTPTPFISYQHHSRVKICWQTVAAFCISHCALSVRAWKSAASLQQLLPCLWTSAQLWCCQVIKAQVMLEGTWVARLCKGTWPAPPTPTSPRHPHYHSPSSQQLLSGLCLCEDTTRRGQCASASFQVGSGCWITFSPQGERKHAARAWKQIQSNVQQQDGNYSRGRGQGGRKKKVLVLQEPSKNKTEIRAQIQLLFPYEVFHLKPWSLSLYQPVSWQKEACSVTAPSSESQLV